tara:strand:- start:895 stop:1314 length:420 start_codon:yes stop_codon:yes gene_type:complete
MGQSQSIKKVNFEDIQCLFKNNRKIILINTLKSNEQDCLIKGTVPIDKEVGMINNNLHNINVTIIVYGKNNVEKEPYNKIKQLLSLGFYNVYLYSGGLFQWLLLQDIYGDEEFPTTKKELDILKFKPRSMFNFLLTDID